jgi:aminoglycoside phosphotransferase (APT) family kinase protein
VLDAWWQEAVADAAMTPPAPVLRHGDVWYRNVLVAGNPPRVAAVLDWGGVAIGDPAEDLAPQFYLGCEFAEAVLARYGSDEAFHARVRRYRELREFAGMRWSVDHRDETELGESVDKLRRSPIFTK